MRIVGLTGGVASGKSTVARRLTELGATVVDADRVAREVLAPGSDGLREVLAAFGPEVLVDGALDRAAMRRRIIQDPTSRSTLEAITHPRIAAGIAGAIGAAAAAGAPVAVVEAALMVETGTWRRYPDGVIVVQIDPKLQIERLLSRDGGDAGDAEGLIGAQLPQAEKVKIARWVLTNNGERDALLAQVDAVWASLTS